MKTKFLVALVAAVLTVLVGDIVCRTLFWDHLYYRPHEMFVRTHPKYVELIRYKRDVQFEGQTFGDLAAMTGSPELRDERKVKFVTDRLGFPNNPATSGSYGALVVGDSFCVGNGSSMEDSWVAQFARARHVSIYNLSLPGSPWQGLMNLKLEQAKIDVQKGSPLILTLYAGNDLDDYYGGGLSLDDLVRRKPLENLMNRLRPLYARSYVKLRLEQIFSPKTGSDVLKREFIDGRPILFYGPYARTLKMDKHSIESLINYTKLKGVIYNFGVACQQKEWRLTVVLIPAKEQVYEWALNGRNPWSSAQRTSGFSCALAQFCASQRIRYLDLAPTLIDRSKDVYAKSGDLLYWRDDTHLSPAGHHVVAEAVASFIRKE